MPSSMEWCDIEQLLFVHFLECGFRFKQNGGHGDLLRYFSANAFNRILYEFSRQYVCSSYSVKHYWRKKGRDVEQGGEVSLEDLSDRWYEFIASPITEENASNDTLIDENKVRMALTEVKAQLWAQDRRGISFAKTRNKYHVEVSILGRKQFVGQFADERTAVEKKLEFLTSMQSVLMEAVGGPSRTQS